MCEKGHLRTVFSHAETDVNELMCSSQNCTPSSSHLISSQPIRRELQEQGLMGNERELKQNNAGCCGGLHKRCGEVAKGY